MLSLNILCVIRGEYSGFQRSVLCMCMNHSFEGRFIYYLIALSYTFQTKVNLSWNCQSKTYLMMSHELNLLFMSISTCIIFIFWVLIMQQLCHTKVSHRQRLYRIITLVVVYTLGIFDNILIYLESFMPEYSPFGGTSIKIWQICYIIEPIALIIGFHALCECLLAIIHNMYLPVNMTPPKWIEFSVRIVKYIYTVLVIFIYSLLLILNKPIYAQYFYVILTGIVCILSFFALYIFCKLLSSLNKINKSNENQDKLNKAKHGIRIGIFLVFCIDIICIISTVIALENILNFLEYDQWKNNQKLIDCIFHSVFLFIIVISLYLWIYQKSECCIYRKRSVCDSCGCTDFVEFWCTCCLRHAARRRRLKKRAQNEEKLKQDDNVDNDHRAVLMEESSKRIPTADTGGAATDTFERDLNRKHRDTNSKLTDYHASIQHDHKSGPTPEYDHTQTDERVYVRM